jgi:hypothetical protein
MIPTNGGGISETQLPNWFINSTNPKQIVVRNCKVVMDDALVNDIKMHSNIVKFAAYDDSFICFTNELMVKPKKYRWDSLEKTIKIWFTNMANQPVAVTAFHVDILLIY